MHAIPTPRNVAPSTASILLQAHRPQTSVGVGRGLQHPPVQQLARIRVAKADRGMPFRVARDQRRAVTRQIGGRCEQQQPEGVQRSRDKARVGQIAAADCDIDALIDQVDCAVAEIDVEFRFWVAREEVRNHRQQEVIADD